MNEEEIEVLFREYLVNKMQIYLSKDEGYLKVELSIDGRVIDVDTLWIGE